MDLNRLKNLEKLRNAFNKVGTLHTSEKRLQRLLEIKTQLQILIEPVKKLKLLSSEEEKKLLRFCFELDRDIKTLSKSLKERQKVLQNIISGKIKIENTRNESDYIIWYGEQIELEKLFNVLISKKYILKLPPSKVKKAIRDHFLIANLKRTVRKKPSKVWWGQTEALLAHLFEKLYSIGKVKDDFYKHIYTNISNHFLNKKGKPLFNKQLEKQYKKAITITYDGSPLGHELIDDVIRIVFADETS